jgi:alpha,alpha-trehalase
MLDKARKIASKTGLFALSNEKALTADAVAPARAYIQAYWKKLERNHKKDDESLLGLPKTYLVPASEDGHEFDFNELYYWDSYFMVQGMLDEEHKELVMGILENLESLFLRFRVIPNASRTYLMGRSQPPLLTSFIFDIYDAYNPGHDWLKKHMAIAQQEYETVWMGVAKPHWRKVHKNLSRYYDINMLHDLAEAESGWDMTPRFNRKALDYVPVDLNALLYKYETDFARAAKLTGASEEVAHWEKLARDRSRTMNRLMWDKLRGLYYDYNYVKEKKGNISSLAAYYPMWAGMVDGRHAQAMVKALKRFENKGGLSTTDALPLAQYVPGALPTQWAYPNGWAPLHFMVIKGLERYGYKEDARRIALKWIKANNDWFQHHGVFLEKYNVVDPDKPPVRGVYPSQTGFGWTNAIFERLCRDYIDTK